MSKIKKLIFYGYALLSLSAIALFSGEEGHHLRKSCSFLLDEFFRSELFERKLGFSLLLEEKQAGIVFENASFVQLSKKKRSKDKEEKKRRKKEEKERKKQEKALKKAQSKEMKKKDKEDEREIKNLGKKNNIPSKEISKKIKELKKQLKLERKTNPQLTLMELFNNSGGFGDSGVTNANPGSDSNLGVQNTSDSMADVNGGNASTGELTKEEKKKQKKQDKKDEKEVMKMMTSSGMTKKEAKAKVKELKKQLKQARKRGNPRLTLINLYNNTGGADGPGDGDGPGGAGTGEGGDFEARLAALESKVNKLILKNKKRKSEIKKINMNISKLAFIVKKMTRNEGAGSSGQAFASNIDDDDE
ncbi:Uncharacterized Protein cmbei_800520 [Cryptosporidium meleagridis]